MLSARGIHLSQGLQTLVEDLDLHLDLGDRMGLVGPNGCGKSTLLRAIAGRHAPDAGHFEHPRELRIGYLAQGWEPEPGRTLGAVLDGAAGQPEALAPELERLAGALAERPGDEELTRRYDTLLDRMARAPAPDRLPALLAELELDGLDRQQPAASLSGGEKTRLGLVLLLLDDPELLLLDEPTNHLDGAALRWLEGWLAGFDGAALVVSHDRAFLEAACNRILAIDAETKRGRVYAGNYSAYVEAVETEQRKQWSDWKEQQEEIRRLRGDIARTKEQARWVEVTTKPNQPTVRRYAKKVAKKAKSRERKLERYLEGEDRVERPGQSWRMKVDWEASPHLGKSVLELDDLAVGYPGRPPLLAGIDLRVEAGARVAILGPNGSGKTSLLRCIAGQLLPASGRIHLGPSVVPGYLAQEQETLDPEASALALVQAVAPQPETEARNFLHFFLFSGQAPLRPSRLLSYGERSRLALALLVAGGCNLLLLDEPTNHLDIPSRERFEQALAGFEGAVLAVSHDRYFVQRFASEHWLLSGGRVERELPVGGTS